LEAHDLAEGAHAGQNYHYTVESLKADAEFRRLTAEEAGLGFHMSVEPELPVAPRTCSAEIAATQTGLVGAVGIEPTT